MQLFQLIYDEILFFNPFQKGVKQVTTTMVKGASFFCNWKQKL